MQSELRAQLIEKTDELEEKQQRQNPAFAQSSEHIH